MRERWGRPGSHGIGQLVNEVAGELGRRPSTVRQWLKSDDPAENRLYFYEVLAEAANRLGLAPVLDEKLSVADAIRSGARVIRADAEGFAHVSHVDAVENVEFARWLADPSVPSLRRYRRYLAHEISAKQGLLCGIDNRLKCGVNGSSCRESNLRRV